MRFLILYMQLKLLYMWYSLVGLLEVCVKLHSYTVCVLYSYCCIFVSIAREAELSHQLNHYLEEVDVLSSLLSNPRTRNIRSTNRKRNSLIKAFCEFYLHLSLLQNFQVRNMSQVFVTIQSHNMQQLNHTGFRKILKKHDKVCLLCGQLLL